eukprot:CAMPEP_0116843856 /NCGR_PEP_ID=MMETSP0418-20121206/12336_1 /TAXON_ID=1158023 /ORGANISM="Astrosyne radiata, Strain 13vi08-1A" /LENGTH=140 /DNA_ID=CAMNT_0004474687 /DNA_START=255 /DNA_END=673 /DNA_ORIENTATION=-
MKQGNTLPVDRPDKEEQEKPTPMVSKSPPKESKAEGTENKQGELKRQGAGHKKRFEDDGDDAMKPPQRKGTAADFGTVVDVPELYPDEDVPRERAFDNRDNTKTKENEKKAKDGYKVMTLLQDAPELTPDVVENARQPGV